MSLLNYLQLQPIDPQEDGTVSELDSYPEDEIIDLTNEEDANLISAKLDDMANELNILDDQ